MSRRRPLDEETCVLSSGDDRPRKRRRNEFESEEGLESRLESLIIRIGEKSTSSIETNIEGLAKVLTADLDNSKTKIIQIICECVAKYPEKTCIYSTLIGLLNAKNYSIGGEIVELLVKHFKDYLKALDFESARLLVRFFGDLVNCRVISSASLMNLFENLVDVSMEDNIPQSRSDYFVLSVLSALPWVGKELYEKKEQDLEQLLNTIDNYLNKAFICILFSRITHTYNCLYSPFIATHVQRHKTHHHTALRVWYSDTPHPQEEYLDCFWAQISKLRSDKWVERHIYRPYLAFDSVLCEALQHSLPQIQPPPHESNYVYPYPKVVFRLFDYTDCPEGPVLPGAHSIERYLIEEHLHWIIDKNYTDRKNCAMNLLMFPNKHKIPLEYMIIEVIFSQMFDLPKSKYLDICYGSTLLELCKLQPSSLPQVLAQAVELLFERLDTMNCMCVDRFAIWFAYHLSNFQFRWSWDDWSSALTLDPLHPKPKFIRETLLRCLRLSFHEQVVKIIPDSFLELAPEEPNPSNKFSAEDPDSAASAVATTLVNKIREKCTPEEALEVLKELTNPLMETEDGIDLRH
ncbi:unnamed protein product [Oppiella nova]|uniref:Nuclear cap-binding protein subunit 1 n=1 Tax=Oppiella nova TaxID=334625 RepID=A0A7R9LX20_9ACAR|nr:unnamed protein product [Oppiella nova]CAG2167490.1 unnamed protein product [Oppiella nova]